MQIALNGKVPTKEQLEALKQVVPTSFSLGAFWEYEENVEWDNMRIEYPNGDVLQSATYTGLWEMTALDSYWELCGEELKKTILGRLFDHFLWYYNPENGIDLEEAITLFEAE